MAVGHRNNTSSFGFIGRDDYFVVVVLDKFMNTCQT